MPNTDNSGGPDLDHNTRQERQRCMRDVPMRLPAIRSPCQSYSRKLVTVGQASYCDGIISVLLGKETSSTLRAVSAPAMGRPSGSSRPS
jgi:hypothetical protein